MTDINRTIAALATPQGTGGIAIVRISGDEALNILTKMFRPKNKRAESEHAKLIYGYVFDDTGDIDEVMAVYFKAPNSYTRQDVCEIHTHGGISANRTLNRIIELGAFPAEAGEFTYRAFINGRLSLDRAEAVMSLISSQSEQAANKSLRQLKYGVGSGVKSCMDEIKDMLTLIDAAADFPEEIDEEVSLNEIKAGSRQITRKLNEIADKRYARIYSSGARVVIAGKPNVGKSSIMNRLLSYDRSIVTSIAGTTRDAINETIGIHGVKITLTDTAGIRNTGDEIEKIGVDIARKLIDGADVVVLVIDSSREIDREDRELLDLRDERFIIVSNKQDIKAHDIKAHEIEGALEISAVTGEGINELTEEIYKKINLSEDDEKLMTLRHIDAANRAAAALNRACEPNELDLIRQDLTDALTELGKITGESISEDIIDAIFEKFCVGK